ncbi:glycosyltransferase family 4 protein [Vibrio sp. MA40-2]|uniref:glycosyltransferase family 4 protein n=1 Tax=Vibrio sp. MA40-2 TaxID=3391828 RepID=UPI0039A5F4D0
MDKKSILIFSDEYPPAGGGSGVIAKRLVDDVRSLGHNVTLLTGDECPDEPDITHVRVHRTTLIWVFSYYKIITKLNLQSYDLIIINDQVSAYIAGRFFDQSTLKKCKVLIHGRDSNFFFNRKSLKHNIFQYEKYYAKLLVQSQKIIAVSRYTLNEYLLHIPEKYKNLINEKLSWHYAGINCDEVCGGVDPFTELYATTKDNTVLLSVGRIVPSKGYMQMLLLLSELIGKQPNYKWVIVGDGEYRSELEQKAIELNISEHIIYTGKVARTSLEHIYKYADCFWLLSIEAFGLVYLEAASFNLPSIAVPFGGATEAVVVGENGYHYDENSDLLALLQQCEQLREKRKPEEFSKQFSTLRFATYLCH